MFLDVDKDISYLLFSNTIQIHTQKTDTFSHHEQYYTLNYILTEQILDVILYITFKKNSFRADSPRGKFEAVCRMKRWNYLDH